MTASQQRKNAEAFKRLVSLYLGARGIPNEQRPYVVRASQIERGEGQAGHLWGIPDVVVNCRTERQFLIGEQVDKARTAAQRDDREFYFSVQFRQGFGDPGDSLVSTDLSTLGRVLQALQRLRELEGQEAAA